jgi:probable rRNA maturation factor
MEIQIKNLQKKVLLNLPQIKKLTKAVLKFQEQHASQISLVFVSRQRICQLNKKYLKRPEATDVLAFDLSDAPGPARTFGRSILIGDIVVSTDAAIQNARIYQTSVSEELMLYIIHGILHLLGFDDHKTRDIHRMRQKEEALLQRLGNRVKGIVRAQS